MIINDTAIAELVRQEVQKAVNQQVESLLTNQEWQQLFEQQIAQFAQQRIAAKFQNVSEIPDIVDTISTSVRNMFDQGHVPGMTKLVDAAQLRQAVDSAIQSLVHDSIDNLVSDRDWVNKIQQSIETNVVTRTTELISSVDLQSLVANQVRQLMDTWKTQLLNEQKTPGVVDQATACELVISDGSVVAQSGLGCTDLLVEQNLVTKNLVVTGTINTDCNSWDELANNVADRTQRLLGHEWQQQLVNQALDLAKTQGIEFQNITIAGQPVISGDTLNAAITNSSLQKVGVLQNLRVTGPVNLAGTFTAGDRRVGVNTDSPDMALSVWDEEVSLSMGKISKDRAWIGSTRQHALDIGVNRRRSIGIEPDGLVSIDRLRVDRWRISFGNSVPNHSGTRGDLVINHDPKPDTPFAWQCLGGYQWRMINLPCV